MVDTDTEQSGSKGKLGCAVVVAVALAVCGLLVVENQLGVLSGCDRDCKERRALKREREFSRLPLDEQEKIIEELRDEERDEFYRGW